MCERVKIVCQNGTDRSTRLLHVTYSSRNNERRVSTIVSDLIGQPKKTVLYILMTFRKYYLHDTHSFEPDSSPRGARAQWIESPVAALQIPRGTFKERKAWQRLIGHGTCSFYPLKRIPRLDPDAGHRLCGINEIQYPADRSLVWLMVINYWIRIPEQKTVDEIYRPHMYWILLRSV